MADSLRVARPDMLGRVPIAIGDSDLFNVRFSPLLVGYLQKSEKCRHYGIGVASAAVSRQSSHNRGNNDLEMDERTLDKTGRKIIYGIGEMDLVRTEGHT
jgi:hypothetical protein